MRGRLLEGGRTCRQPGRRIVPGAIVGPSCIRLQAQKRDPERHAIRITHTGCAHYVQRYELTVRGAVRDTADSHYWLVRGAEYLETLATVENVQSQISDMIKGLRGAASAPATYAYGDPIRASELAHVYFSVRGAGPRAVVIEIVYDYAL